MSGFQLEERTLPQILRRQAEKQPDATYLTFGETSTTFGEIDEVTNRIANTLRSLGVSKGDRVAMVLPNCLEIVQTWFALAKLGAVEVPVNMELRGPLLAHVLGNSGAQIVLVHRDLLADVTAVLNSTPSITTVVVVGSRGLGAGDARAAGVTAERTLDFGEILWGSEAAIDTEVAYTDPLAILYTSGTTGPAKGVVMPHHQYYVWVDLYAKSLQLSSEDTYFTPLPLFHADGQLWGAYFPLVYGTSGTFVERFSATRYWDQIRACGATATNMLGAMGHILWKQPEQANDADNPLRVAQAIPMLSIKEEFQERFGVSLVAGYGQTETNWVSYDTPGNGRPGSCGKVADEHFEVRIVDELDQPLPARSVGQIVVRPKQPWSISLEYHANPTATLSTWRNLWFHSGDAGYLDEDGWLYFSDRIKDVIRRKGSNISAFELESVIEGHPQVQECAAVAVPSELSEDEVLVFVMPQPGEDLDPAALHAFCVENLPRFMVPRYLDITTEPLPRTPTEKISKTDLRERGLSASTWDAETLK